MCDEMSQSLLYWLDFFHTQTNLNRIIEQSSHKTISKNNNLKPKIFIGALGSGYGSDFVTSELSLK